MWKDIKGFEGLYKIDRCGNVLNVKKNVLLKPFNNGNGYLKVHLYKERKDNKKYVHRLVAETYIPNPDELKEVNHKDENKANNNVENLEWCSHTYNMNYGTHNQRMSLSKSKAVLQLDINLNVINEFVSSREADRILGINNSNIIQCCKGKRKTAGGYYWKYK